MNDTLENLLPDPVIVYRQKKWPETGIEQELKRVADLTREDLEDLAEWYEHDAKYSNSVAKDLRAFLARIQLN